MSIPRPNRLVATRIRFWKSLNCWYRDNLNKDNGHGSCATRQWDADDDNYATVIFSFVHLIRLLNLKTPKLKEKQMT